MTFFNSDNMGIEILKPKKQKQMHPTIHHKSAPHGSGGEYRPFEVKQCAFMMDGCTFGASKSQT